LSLGYKTNDFEQRNRGTAEQQISRTVEQRISRSEERGNTALQIEWLVFELSVQLMQLKIYNSTLPYSAVLLFY